MNASPLVSVILPFYNRQHTLYNSILSILNQSFSDFELILIDDGSTDSSCEIVNHFSDKRIRYIYQNNQGACIARNTGISLARGEYIAFQDSDDIWRSDKLQKQLDALTFSNSDVCFCRFQRHDLHGAATDIWPKLPSGPVSVEQLIRNSVVSTQTILAKKTIFKKYVFDSTLKRLQDYDWVISVSQSYSFFLVDDILVDVFIQNDSLTMSGSRNLYNSYRYILTKHLQDFSDNTVVQSYLFDNTGRSFAHIGSNPFFYYKSSIKKHFSFKVFIKMLLTYLHIYY